MERRLVAEPDCGASAVVVVVGVDVEVGLARVEHRRVRVVAKAIAVLIRIGGVADFHPVWVDQAA